MRAKRREEEMDQILITIYNSLDGTITHSTVLNEKILSLSSTTRLDRMVNFNFISNFVLDTFGRVLDVRRRGRDGACVTSI